MRALLLALLLLFPLFAAGDDAAARERRAPIERRLAERPNDPVLWFYLARVDSESGDVRGCVAALEKVDALGDGFLPPRDLFEKAWGDAGFQAIRAKLEARLPRLDYAATAFELQEKDLVPEGIAYDAPSATFFVGSITQHRIVRVDAATREETEFAGKDAGLDAVLGIAVDAPRRRLYAVSTSAIGDPMAERRNAIVAFDLVTRRLVRRVELPQAVQLNDVAVALGGRVFATDSGAGAVYEIPPQGEARVVVAAGKAPGANGLAASPDGRKLYVAHATGIAVVDLVNGEMKRVALPPRENAAAIDGLYQWQGMLIGVQNVTTPGRVIALALARDGESVTQVRTLLSHHQPGLGEPTTGAIAPDGFYLLANTSTSQLDGHGHIRDPLAITPARVLHVLLPR